MTDQYPTTRKKVRCPDCLYWKPKPRSSFGECTCTDARELLRSAHGVRKGPFPDTWYQTDKHHGCFEGTPRQTRPEPQPVPDDSFMTVDDFAQEIGYPPADSMPDDETGDTKDLPF